MNLSSQALAWIGAGLRLAGLAIFVLWVVVSWFFLYRPSVNSDQLAYWARKNLAAGQRLRPQDFEFVPFIPKGERNQVPPEADPAGKYLLPPVVRGQTFVAADVSSMPVINASPNTVKYLLPLKNQPELADKLNRNSHVMICAGSCMVENARVLSVMCGNAAPADCNVLLELTKDDVDALAKTQQQFVIVQKN